jgi:hypothetical protein
MVPGKLQWPAGDKCLQRMAHASVGFALPMRRYAAARLQPFEAGCQPALGMRGPQGVLNGIICVLRSGAPGRDLPERFGPRTPCYNRSADGGKQVCGTATAKRGIEIIVSVVPEAG